MTLAYLLPLDCALLAHGYRSRLRPLICTRPIKRPRVTVESINQAFKGIKP